MSSQYLEGCGWYEVPSGVQKPKEALKGKWKWFGLQPAG